MEEKGWTITFVSWDDMGVGKEKVVGRFKTTEEKDKFLNDICKPNSGWIDEEELMTIGIHNDYNYVLPK